jgi:hypothetical protein
MQIVAFVTGTASAERRMHALAPLIPGTAVMPLRREGWTDRATLMFWTAAAALALLSLLPVPRGFAPSAGAAIRESDELPTVAQEMPLWMEMRMVDLHVNAAHAIHVRSLRGRVLANDSAAIPWLDDPSTFRLQVTSGTVAVEGPALAALLNERAFNYQGAPIRDLQVSFENGEIVQRGIMHKGVDLPFQMRGSVELQPDGRVKLHPRVMRILGVNGKTLLHALGLRLADVLDLRQARGVSVRGDDLYLEPLAILPPPSIEGRLTSVRIAGEEIVQEFARTPDDTIFGSYARVDSTLKHFVYFRGGLLRFGRLHMTDTDLVIRDADESDPLDLYLPEYNRQLVAGLTHNLRHLGLEVFMPDYADVVQGETVRPVISKR